MSDRYCTKKSFTRVFVTAKSHLICTTRTGAPRFVSASKTNHNENDDDDKDVYYWHSLVFLGSKQANGTTNQIISVRKRIIHLKPKGSTPSRDVPPPYSFNTTCSMTTRIMEHPQQNQHRHTIRLHPRKSIRKYYMLVY